MSEKDSRDHANERLHESLSAVLDGEASEIELHRVLDSFENDQDLKQKAIRYQRIGAAIRREPYQVSDMDFSAKIMAEIDKEDAFAGGVKESSVTHSLTERFFSSWPSALGKVSAAALVMLAVVFSLRNYNIQQQAVQVADSDIPESVLTLDPTIQLKTNDYSASGILAGLNDKADESGSPDQFAHAKRVADGEMLERFQTYALQHAELSLISTGQGVLPFARLTSFEAK